MKKRKKLWIVLSIVLVVLIGLGIGGYYVGNRYVVNFAFDRYVMSPVLETIKQSAADATEPAASSQEEITGEGKGTPKPKESTPSEAKDTKKPSPKPADEMSESELAEVVSRSPSLTEKLLGMISYSDKERVVNILMSNFTPAEIADYTKRLSSGLSMDEKNELKNMAISRVSPEQMSECMQIFYRYMDQLKPAIQEAIGNQ